ncbi:hypothetical protein FIBSPDRAFT_1045177 [Athelia psychrophila]|uniref:Extracellular membrane protein CFEM domain-containing protein n=1 Tax=Athelia psychrophila TaxID=1759441 RepID=A0A166IL14_9AGAM|nr:hypothetical protein FIBSPDRAFT_1045177 [Fibularhizoctonia sp. CBS 109695]
MIPSSIFYLALALLASSPFTKAQSDNVTCTTNPAGYALICLQNAGYYGDCSAEDTSCLCTSLSSNGNVEIFDSKCISDGCFNDIQPGETSAQVEAAYSSVIAAQSSICSPYTATGTSLVTATVTPAATR